MARIRKEDHARILEMVDVEERKVGEVAVAFGCTTANIYALLGKLRRATFKAEHDKSQTPLELEETKPAPADDNVLAFERMPPVTEVRPVRPPAPPRPAPVPVARMQAAPEVEAAPEPREKISKLGAKLAKPGVGLVMRTADGEESMSPFRSLDDLLSAIKPILRATARNADPVWFSLQPVDLSAIEIDAA
ncbi:hypothetical protein [Acidisoma cladoniae]|jgi:hypothetical protein|uniref:hypothetical protein n=1 Tax=Acidisoma cladoniae TaxID=3040935 RepID=UPI00254D27A8|nr:hypothetical protein [Acidisoma sp. PAMC 29798]